MLLLHPELDKNIEVGLSLSVSELKSASSPEQFGLQGPCQLIVKKQLTNHNIPSQP